MRRYIADDVLHRLLLVRGFKVRRIINITDVGHLTRDDIDRGEDKMLVAAVREGKSPMVIADYYTKAFMADSQALALVQPEQYTRATDHITEMLALIERLIAAKKAYVSNGSVYFSVAAFPEYGALSGNTLSQLRSHVRAELKDEVLAEKRAPEDFVLWVKAPKEHLLQWPSPWGQGYPGWHIECAAMILKHLGETIDIHTGGEDHIFPHHEDEIAEAQGATGKPLARFWMHVRHLFVDSKRMAKREGTFLRLEDLVAKGYQPLAFRFLALSAHYGTRLNFTWEALDAATEGWTRVTQTVSQLRERLAAASGKTTATSSLTRQIKELMLRFNNALDDNLGTPQALAVLSELVSLSNTVLSTDRVSIADINLLLETFLEMDRTLAILPSAPAAPLDEDELIWLKKKLDERTRLRTNGSYKEADAIRKEIAAHGIDIEDRTKSVRYLKKATGQSGVVELE
jgi:cysteinyl-tRNA synthetase